MFQVGGECQAYIAHISSSGDFFIQVFGPGIERLEILMEDMTSHFSQVTLLFYKQMTRSYKDNRYKNKSKNCIMHIQLELHTLTFET